jgi:hypothetical protein
LRAAFTKTEHDQWLVERLDLSLMAVLLLWAGRCSSGRAKSAHVVSHLPDEAEEDDKEVTRLFECARSLPTQECRTKELPRLHDHPARQAWLQVSWSKIQIQPPKNGGALEKQALQAWVIRVWGPSPPPGEEALEWVLLTSMPIENEGSGQLKAGRLKGDDPQSKQEQRRW